MVTSHISRLNRLMTPGPFQRTLRLREKDVLCLECNFLQPSVSHNPLHAGKLLDDVINLIMSSLKTAKYHSTMSQLPDCVFTYEWSSVIGKCQLN